MIAASFWAAFCLVVAVGSGISVFGIGVFMITAPAKVRWQRTFVAVAVLVLVCATAVGGAVSLGTVAGWQA